MIKVYCSGLDLSSGISRVINAVATKTVNPILEGIKIIAENDSLTLIGSDSNLTITTTIKADVVMGGEIVVNAKFFSDYIKQLATSDVQLTENEKGQLRIVCNDSEVNVAVYDVAEYPEIAKIENSKYFTINSNDFKDMVKKVIVAVATDETRPILKGVKFEISQNKIRAVSVDGYRFAKVDKTIDYNKNDFEFIVNGRDLKQIAKLINDNENMTIFCNDNYLSLETENTIIISRLLSGQFINYNQIISNNYNMIINLDKKELCDVLDKCEIIAKQINNVVCFDINSKNMKISSVGENFSFNGNLSIQNDLKESLIVKYNLSYVQDFLSNIEEDNITIKFINRTNILLIESDYYTFLILPVK